MNVEKKYKFIYKSILLLVLAIIFFNSFISLASSKDYHQTKEEASDSKELVILLHGIIRTSCHMRKLANHLKNNGYHVRNLDYPSTKYPLEDLIEIINKKGMYGLKNYSKVHFVGYSMGGLLVRGLLNKYKPNNLGNVVLLATPNHGSEIADILQNNWLYKKLYGPAGQQLTTNQSLNEELLGKVNYHLGVIAGSFTIDPISSFFISGPDDGKVSIKSTMLSGMADHIVVNSCHTFFPTNKEVLIRTLEFIKYGKFFRSKA